MPQPYESDVASWFVAGKNPRGYETGPGYLRSRQPNTPEFGTIMKELPTDAAPAAGWVGKRLRFRGEVKAEGVAGRAGLWMRVDGPRIALTQSNMLAFDNMTNRPIVGTANWTHRDVVLDVPAGARGVCFGLLLLGDGEVWIRDVTLAVVGADTSTTDSRLTTLRGWVFDDNLKPFLTALGWITRYDFGPEDWNAVYFGVRDTDMEADRWYDHPLATAPKASVGMARDAGSSVVNLRIDVADWQRREVELAMEIFGRFLVAGSKFEAPE